MNQNRFSLTLIAGIVLGLFFGVALYLRIALPYDTVFVGDWVRFIEVDAYYHMRIVDNLVHNFPRYSPFDPYMVYPGGWTIGPPLLFNYLLAGIIWLAGLGSPSQRAIDVIGAYFPAVLGALTIIPVYFIGKALFNRWAGVIAAGLIAILPGQFLIRSLIGYTDYHVAEVLFTTTAMLFLILAVKSARQKELTFSHVKRRDWTVISKPLLYSFLAGIFLGIYFLTWAGALLFVFIISVYLVIQFIIDHLRRRSTHYLGFVGAISFIVALAMFLPMSPDKLSLASLIIAIFIPIFLAGLSHVIAAHRLKPLFYPLTVLGLGLVSLVVFYIINPSLLGSIIGRLGIFIWPIKTIVSEMQPLFFFLGQFTWSTMWKEFTTTFFLTLISSGILIYLVIKHGEPDKTLLVIWSLITLAATLSMLRFGYYFAINVALLTGYLSWLILQFAGFKEAKPVEMPKGLKKKARSKKLRKEGFRITTRRLNMALGVIVIFFLVFFPNISVAITTANQVRGGLTEAWYESLSWLKNNTPEPLGNPDSYYQLHTPPPPGESYKYPETAYGVAAWWDTGYWITRIAQRIPNANPDTHAETSLFYKSTFPLCCPG